VDLRLADFAGTWEMERRIEDALSGLTSHLEGRASFTPAGGALALDEAGTLSIPGHAPVAAARRYLWAQDGGGIAVSFADGRPFHRFDPAAVPCGARHDCAPDVYRVDYDFAAWPRWRAVWQVRGPRKDYRMTTDYRR
jgi:hypothetical protein